MVGRTGDASPLSPAVVTPLFERRKIAKVFMTHVQVFFRKSLSKATFEIKLSSVSLALEILCRIAVLRR